VTRSPQQQATLNEREARQAIRDAWTDDGRCCLCGAPRPPEFRLLCAAGAFSRARRAVEIGIVADLHQERMDSRRVAPETR
jgi:hypothetical protein